MKKLVGTKIDRSNVCALRVQAGDLWLSRKTGKHMGTVVQVRKKDGAVRVRSETYGHTFWMDQGRQSWDQLVEEGAVFFRLGRG